MADVRVNGKRIPPLQSVANLGILVQRLENMAVKCENCLTSLQLNQKEIDLESQDVMKMHLDLEDTIDARFETAEHLSFESLQIAVDMASLLLLDLKIATVRIWKKDPNYTKSLEMLIKDCYLFLSLGARPLTLLNKDPQSIPNEAQRYLKELDFIADKLEDATLLAVNGKNEDACFILMRVIHPAIERWTGLSSSFAQHLEINIINNTDNFTDVSTQEI